jgi:hypothetical protein
MTKLSPPGISRRVVLSTLAVLLFLPALVFPIAAPAQTDANVLPLWNDGPAKQAVLDFVRATTDSASTSYVKPEDRVATFDQDGTTWVSHPMYTQLMFALDRVVELAPKHPEWKKKQPFKAVITGDKEAMAKFTMKDLEQIIFATHTGMTTEVFQATRTGSRRRGNLVGTALTPSSSTSRCSNSWSICVPTASEHTL